MVGLRHQDVVVAGDARPKSGEVALARNVQHGRAVVTPGGDRHLVERRRTGERSEDGYRRHAQAETESPAGLVTVGPEMGERDRPADDLGLAARAPRDVVGEKELLGERRCQPVGEAEVRVGLCECGGDTRQACGQHHRAGHIAAAPQNDVRPAPLQDRPAGKGRLPCAPERPQQCHRGRPREAVDRECVELKPCFRNQLRLDAVGTAGERHVHAARSQRFPDRERRPDVTGCPSRRDHDCELR